MRDRNLPLNDRRASSAFTLIEMMVVIGMLAILMGVAFSGLGQARARAREAKANAEVRELMNAVLAYEAANDVIDVPGGALDATEDKIEFLLNKDRDPKKRVYLNAQIVNGAFRDPWGKPYQFRVIERPIDSERTTVSAAITFPNRHRYVR